MVAYGTLRGTARNWRVVVGLAAMYLWTWFLYWGGALSLRGYTMELVNVRWSANVVACALACGVAAVAAHLMPDGRRFLGGLRLAGPLCSLAGSVLSVWLVFAPPAEGPGFAAAAVAAGLCTGAGEGFLLCLWCTVTSSLGVRFALAHNVVALVGSGLVFLACNVAPSAVSVAMSLLCPVVGYLCAGSYVRRGTGTADPAGPVPAGAPARPAASPSGASVAARFADRFARTFPVLADRPVRMLLAIALIFGFSCGFMNASFEVVPKSLYWVSCWGVVVGTILAAGLTVLTAFVLKLDAWQLAFQTALPLMAVAYFMFPYEAFWYAGPGLHSLGYQYFFITFWSLLGSKQLLRDEPAVRAVPLGLFATELGAVLGLALWSVACTGIEAEGLRLLASVAALVAVVVAVLFERPRFGWGNVRPGAAADVGRSAARAYDDVLDRMRTDYGLSPRERDVCALLGRGRNRQFVADELGISLETAKTHATNVYRKVGVHSQQELLDVIEMTGDLLERERHDCA